MNRPISPLKLAKLFYKNPNLYGLFEKVVQQEQATLVYQMSKGAPLISSQFMDRHSIVCKKLIIEHTDTNKEVDNNFLYNEDSVYLRNIDSVHFNSSPGGTPILGVFGLLCTNKAVDGQFDTLEKTLLSAIDNIPAQEVIANKLISMIPLMSFYTIRLMMLRNIFPTAYFMIDHRIAKCMTTAMQHPSIKFTNVGNYYKTTLDFEIVPDLSETAKLSSQQYTFNILKVSAKRLGLTPLENFILLTLMKAAQLFPNKRVVQLNLIRPFIYITNLESIELSPRKKLKDLCTDDFIILTKLAYANYRHRHGEDDTFSSSIYDYARERDDQ